MRISLLLVMVLLALLLLAFKAPLNKGKSWLSWQQGWSAWQDEPARLLREPAVWVRQQPTVVYRWRDEAGHWHYGQTPPSGVSAEAIMVASPATISSEQMRSGEGLTD